MTARRKPSVAKAARKKRGTPQSVKTPAKRARKKRARRAKPKSQLVAPAGAALAGGALVDRSLREAEVMQRKGYPYLIHPLMDGVPRVQPALLQAWIDWAVAQRDILAGATLILAPEAMGLPLAAPLSLATGIPYAVIRKRRYDLPGEEVAFAETGYGESALHVNDAWPDDRIVIVDDVLSTGGTLTGILTTLAGMGVKVQGVLLFVDKGTRRRAIAESMDVPVRAMRAVDVAHGKVRIRRAPRGPEA